jgi:uncharacterized protein
MMTRLALLLLLIVGLVLWDASATSTALAQQAPDCALQPYAVAQVPAAPQLQLELARTSDEHTRGLMYRTSMPDSQGMLFIFQGLQRGPFWNMNTYLPLSIAYIAADGTILDLQDMQVFEPAQQPVIYYPAAPYLYALEVNRGWFANNGIKVGDQLAFCLPIG